MPQSPSSTENQTSTGADIVYTHTDEAPALATRSWLPIVEKFAAAAGVTITTKDISLAGRILAAFPEAANATGQDVEDALATLGQLATTPAANIIKLPNISASIPQLTAAITELQNAGLAVPDFPAEPGNDKEREIRRRYAAVLGSAVNPVLREGNSDRRVAAPVKKYAAANPHSMGEWTADSQTHVAHMSDGDFYGSEKSVVIDSATTLHIEHVDGDGNTTPLRDPLPVTDGEVVDAAVMSRQALREFLKREIDDARDKNLLLSLHLKATMMKVSDPILFGHAVSVYHADTLDKHAAALQTAGFNPNNGVGALTAAADKIGEPAKSQIAADLQSDYDRGPKLAMVDSDRGITNLHVPSDIIIDASMPAAIRVGGKMWGPDGKLHDTKAIIPDRSYAGVYAATIEFCKQNGKFDVTKMGTVHNVGLMAKKAQEYGSHDKTFEIPAAGRVVVRTEDGQTLIEQDVAPGDIFRMCQTKDVAIRDWVKLAVTRARQTGWPAVFWLDPARGHDAQLIRLVQKYLADHDTDGLDIQIMDPVAATRHACERAAAGQNTISVTGNVLRDYLTDLFPILELGTSAKMLSIVPLLAGGGLFETGAGGSAPKHVQQFVDQGHLRWDSLGEFLALAVSLEDLSRKKDDSKIRVLAECLDRATETFLTEDKSPGRKVGQLDTRGSHYYMALYWAEELAKQTEDAKLSKTFTPVAEQLRQNESEIVDQLKSAAGHPTDIGGYYRPDPEKTTAAMRPSPTLNQIIDKL